MANKIIVDTLTGTWAVDVGQFRVVTVYSDEVLRQILKTLDVASASTIRSWGASRGKKITLL